MVVSGIVMILAAIVVAITAEGCASGKIRMNGAIGIRIGSVMASQEAWLAGHKAARVQLLLAAGALFIGGLLGVLPGVSMAVSNIGLLISMVACLVFLGFGTAAAIRAANLVSVS